MKEIHFDNRYRGPFSSVNGGFLTGTLLDAAAMTQGTVRLRRPVPLDEPVTLFAEDGWAAIRHCDETLAETIPADVSLSQASFVTIDEALDARDAGLDLGMFADCFVCGRGQPNGLGVEPRLLDDGRFVAVWHPAGSDMIDDGPVPARLLNAVLDCPGGFASINAAQRLAVTGSMTTRVDFLPAADQRLIVVGEAGPQEGRRLYATTTIFTESDEVVATAEAIWVTLEAMPIYSAA